MITLREDRFVDFNLVRGIQNKTIYFKGMSTQKGGPNVDQIKMKQKFNLIQYQTISFTKKKEIISRKNQSGF